MKVIDMTFHAGPLPLSGMVGRDDSVLGTLPNIGIPVKLAKTPWRIHRRAPALGEHSREILSEAGFTEAQVEEMVDAGVVAVAENADMTSWSS